MDYKSKEVLLPLNFHVILESEVKFFHVDAKLEPN